jgi:hypothetical protein
VLLELVRQEPAWDQALGVALTLPPGMEERRAGEDPWTGAGTAGRPRRIADDLAWLRQAFEDPADHGLQPLPDVASEGAWTPDPTAVERLERLRARGVLDAAGFLLHDTD